MKRYIGGIDGLRAIAVIAVLLFHAFPKLLPGGFIGVDIFFVISGFIITRKYFGDLQSSNVSLPQFYVRRVRRLAPVYVLVIFATTAVAYVSLTPPLLKIFGAGLGAQPFYAQNFEFWNEGDYFDSPLSKPLLHTWSLAVEEQFYIMYGLMILLARRFPRGVVPVVVLAGFLSFAIGYELAPISPKTSFYWLPMRVWEFALGMLVTGVTFHSNPQLAKAIRMLGLSLVIMSVTLFNETAHFPGWQSAFACFGTALALYSLMGGARSALLESAPMTYFGRNSYSLYLWHWPIIVFGLSWLGHASILLSGAALLATAMLSHFSVRYVEEPFRRRTIMPNDRHLVGTAVLTGACVLGVAISLLISDGAAYRYTPEIANLYRAELQRAPYRCSIISRIRSYPSEICALNNIMAGGNILIIGDSHADQLHEVISEVGLEHGHGVFLTARNCTVPSYADSGYCGMSVLNQVARDIKKYHVEYIFAISYLKPDIDKATLFRNTDILLATGIKKLYFMHDVPSGPYFSPEVHINALLSGKALPQPVLADDYEKESKVQREAITAVAQRSDRIAVLDPVSRICNFGICPFESNGKPIYFDASHLSPTGAQLLRPMFSDVVTNLP